MAPIRRKRKGRKRTNRPAAIVSRSVTFSTLSPQIERFIIHTDQDCHILGRREFFSEQVSESSPVLDARRPGVLLESTAEGEVFLEVSDGYRRVTLHLWPVFFVPNFEGGIFSLRNLKERNNAVLAEGSAGAASILIDGRSFTLARAFPGCEKTYSLSCKPLKRHALDNAEATISEWHRRLGHGSRNLLRMAENNKIMAGLCIDPIGRSVFCGGCLLNDNEYKECLTAGYDYEPPTAPEGDHVNGLVHVALCGDEFPASRGGCSSAVVFMDHATRYTSVVGVKDKTNLTEAIERYISLAEMEFGRPVCVFRTCRDEGFMKSEVRELLRSKKVRHQVYPKFLLAHDETLAQDVARLLVFTAKSMIRETKLPRTTWLEFLVTAAYLRNRFPVKCLKYKTPYEVAYREIPDVSHLRIVGSKVKARDANGIYKDGYTLVGYAPDGPYRLLAKDHTVLESNEACFQ